MIGAAAILRRAAGGSRWALGLGVLALLGATWIRYESWPLALVLPGPVYLARRRRGGSLREALGEAAIGAIPLLGPIAWLWRQGVEYGDPLAFMEQADLGDPSSLAARRGAPDRAGAWASATAAWPRRRGGARVGAVWRGRSVRGPRPRWGVLGEIGLGREHEVFRRSSSTAWRSRSGRWPRSASRPRSRARADRDPHLGELRSALLVAVATVAGAGRRGEPTGRDHRP